MADYILEMENITKDFSGVKALNDVNLKVKRGEIHSICGENGAGKSTLMKVLSGLYPFGQYDGKIIYNNEEMKFKNMNDSEAEGIVIIHQELALSPYLSIKENIFLGNEQATRGIIDWNATDLKAMNLLKTVGLNLDPNTIISEISVGQQQLVEIAKAFSKTVKLLILDEPTASLNEQESQNLLDLLEEFRHQGITSIIISHKLNEVTQIADSITILRDGKTIQTLDNADKKIDENIIVKGMVGRELTNRYPERNPNIGEILYEVKDWTVHHPNDKNKVVIDKVNFNIRKGEIVGIAGLMGAGRTEFAMSMFGKSYGTNISGSMHIHGKEVTSNDVSEAIENGLAYVSEDRKDLGLDLLMSIKNNITLSNLHAASNKGVVDFDQEVQVAEDYRKRMNIKTNDIENKVTSLSGGNQQKVVISKWLYTEPEVLFLDEPTRGIDVGAKYEIYSIIEEMSQEGKAVCIISSELPEILGMCDRIYTMNEGKMTGEILRADADQEVLMSKMTSLRGVNNE
ncbi:multiple monosaccharide ABC transporter ATP-binding protein [Fundicoccus ignavus]|uniref:ATP-binding cassette domain-containing protein n=1 Tax=Fundicoccus ignavus TaxID=2664442 RepID=A0A844BXT0_9LACT|nr:multiple monosaccharide ABC transporter ATP-binding protein [Fundicoccus ignavus]MRJ46818.1 ATP-binding cassette domain-containing protein [Fundicoccus ignavus]